MMAGMLLVLQVGGGADGKAHLSVLFFQLLCSLILYVVYFLNCLRTPLHLATSHDSSKVHTETIFIGYVCMYVHVYVCLSVVQCLAAIVRKLKTQDLNDADNEKVRTPHPYSFHSYCTYEMP